MNVAYADTLGATLATVQAWWNKTVSSQAWIVQMGMWALLGFALGFVIKYLGKPLFWLLLGASLTFYLLHVLHIAVIDYGSAMHAVGLSPNMTLSQVGQALLHWIGIHKGESVSLVIGFFVGWQLT